MSVIDYHAREKHYHLIQVNGDKKKIPNTIITTIYCIKKSILENQISDILHVLKKIIST